MFIFLSFVVSSFFYADDETEEEKDLTFCFLVCCQPETFGDIGVLLFLLNHQTALPPHSEHGVHDVQLGHLHVEEVQPQLVHCDEGPCPSDARAAVDKNRRSPRRICGRVFGLRNAKYTRLPISFERL